jgi:fibronectin-binding autotransporter adhesin
MDQSIRRGLVLAAATITIAGLPQPGRGSATWKASPANNLWSDTNWTSGGDLNYHVVSGDGLIFPASSITHLNQDLVGFTFQPIGFLPGAGPYIIDGNSFTLGGELDQFATNTLTMNTPIVASGTPNFSAAPGGTLLLNGVISGAGSSGLTVSGGGTVVFAANNTYTGSTVLDNGTVVYSTDNPNVKQFVFGFVAKSASTASMNVNADVSAGSVLVQTNSAVANQIAIAAGKTLTVNGGFFVGPSTSATDSGVTTAMTVSGNGTLAINTPAGAFAAGTQRANESPATVDPFATLDLSGLSNFTFTTSGPGQVRVGYGGNCGGILRLANTLNRITANAVQVGNSNGQDAGAPSTLTLGGGSNVINTGTINIGASKQSGWLKFDGAGGSVSIAGQTGGASVANIFVSNITATPGPAPGIASSLDLAGHAANVQAGSLVIGRLTYSGSPTQANSVGSVAFDTGTLSVATLQLAAHASGIGASVTRGELTVGGPAADDTATGVLNVNNQFLLFNRTSTTGSTAASTFTINGGTANVNTDILIVDSASSGTRSTTLTLAAGTLNMMGHAIATAALPINNVNLPAAGQTARIANLGGTGINGAGLTKNGVGTLVMEGNNTFSGGTTINFGTLIFRNKIPTGLLNVDGGTLQVAAKATPNDPLGISVVSGLFFGSGVCDLTNNSMIIDYLFVGPQLGIVQGSLFNGQLTSTSATPTTRLGYGETSALGITSYKGIPVDDSAIIIKYTYAGDADLDGDADGVDIGTWATNFTGELGGGGFKVWTQGDWDYDGDVDGVDAGLWATAFTGELGGGGLGTTVFIDQPIAPGAAAILQGLGITVIPEPVSAAFLALCFAATARARIRVTARSPS